MSLSELILDKRKGYLTSRVESIKVDDGVSLVDGANQVTMRAASGTGSYSFRLPSGQGSAGETLVNDGAGNLSWAPGGGGGGGGGSGTVDVYINTDTGNDANDGMTPATAVSTIVRAIEVAEGESGDQLNINIDGNNLIQVLDQSLDLYNPSGVKYGVINLSRCSNLYSIIRIVGTRDNSNTDTIASINPIDPFAQWDQINTNIALPVSTYQYGHLYNSTKKKYFTIQDNAATTIDLVGGGNDPSDSIEVYTLKTVIQAPFGLAVVGNALIEFVDVDFVFANPILNSTSQPLTLSGCDFHVSIDGFLYGDFICRGVFNHTSDLDSADNRGLWNIDIMSFGSLTDIQFTGQSRIRDIYFRTGTLEVDKTIIDVLNCKCDNTGSGRPVLTINRTQSIVTVENLWGVSDSSANGINILENGYCRIVNLDLTTTSSNCISISGTCGFEGDITMVGPNVVGKRNIEAFGGNLDFTAAGPGNSLTLSGCPRGMDLFGSNVNIDESFSVDITTVTDHGIYAAYGTELNINPGTLVFNCPGDGVHLLSRSNLSTPLVVAPNSGAGNSLKVGANPSGAWTTNADLTTQYCIAYIGP